MRNKDFVYSEALRNVEKALEPGLVSDCDIFHGLKWMIGRKSSYGLSLVASENLMSPRVKLMECLSGSMGLSGRYDYTLIDDAGVVELEEIAKRETQQMLEADLVDVRSVSGHNANLAVFGSLLEPGDRVIAVPASSGGHASHTSYGTLGERVRTSRDRDGLVIPFKMEKDGYHIDVDWAVDHIKSIKPKLVAIGRSTFLFEEPVRELSEACNEVGSILYYDAAHPLGLIMHGAFQDPLKDGAHVVGASTHKTFAGPQGGIVYTNQEHAKVFSKVKQGVIDNTTSPNVGRYPALISAFREFDSNRKYGPKVVENAKALAESLDSCGIAPEGKAHGYTDSHQVVFEVRNSTGVEPEEVRRRLRNNFVHVTLTYIPSDEGHNRKSALRLGTQELTRRGMGKEEMSKIAQLVSDVVLLNQTVREEVTNLSRSFSKVVL